MTAPSTLRELQTMVDQFAQERAWEKYHSPKNLAMSVAIEAAELMEHFQWTSTAVGDRRAPNASGSSGPEILPALSSETKMQVGEEMADVLAYLLRLASVLDIDLASAFVAKVRKNELKYPTDRVHRFGDDR